MKIAKILIFCTCLFIGLLALQVFTYLTVAPRQLKEKLFAENISCGTYAADTAYVWQSAAHCGNSKCEFIALDLQENETAIKEKLHVKQLYFNHNLARDSMMGKCKLDYTTFSDRPERRNLLDLFTVEQTEMLKLNRELVYFRYTSYRWCLFFWIKRFERKQCYAVK